MYFRACAMVRSGHQDLLITEMRVRPSYAAVKEGGGVCMCGRGRGGGEGRKDCNSALVF